MSYPIHHAFRTPPGRRASRGFTLIELMITITVGAILVALAVPSFQSVFTSSRINGQANEFLATLQLARMEAVRRNARVVVCPSANGTSCLAGNPTTWTGWLSFVDDGGFSHSYATGVAANAGNGVVDANETILRTGTVNTPVIVKTSTNVSGSAGGAITFRSDGMARDVSGNMLSGMISVCVASPHPADNIRNVVIFLGSRMSVARASGGGVCNVPANPTLAN